MLGPQRLLHTVERFGATMPTPTDDRHDLLTVIAYMTRFAGMVGDLIDENGLTITRLHRIA
jgi:hypothetical protein